jgi:formate dehydrogenase iron-sulfur subunit
VTESGLRGRGGAGFPAGIKWRTVADAEGEQKYIACNADEGDSGTFSDRMLMEGDPFGLIEALAIAGFAVGANKGYIYLRSEYPLTNTILSRAIDTAREAGWLGADIQGSGFDFDIELHLGAGSYVCGEETAMLESLEGKKGIVRYKPPLPAHAGLFGKPTVVNNVVTLSSLAISNAAGSSKSPSVSPCAS